MSHEQKVFLHGNKALQRKSILIVLPKREEAKI